MKKTPKKVNSGKLIGRINKLQGFVLLAVLVGVAAIGYYFLIFNKTPADNKYFSKAEDLNSTRYYSEALQEYKKAINHDPSHTDSYVRAAEILEAKGRNQEALDLLLLGVDFASDQAKLNNEIAENYAELGEFEKAANYALKATKDKGEPKYELNYISYLSLSGNTDQAVLEAKTNELSNEEVKNYLKAIGNSEEPNTALNYATKANSNAVGEKYSPLVEAINLSINNQEKKVESLMKIADYIFEQENYALVLPILKQVREENQYYEGSYIYEAFVYEWYDLEEEALKMLDTAFIYAPQNSDLHRIYAKAYLDMQRYDEAKEALSRANQYSQSSSDLLYLEFQIAVAEENWNKVVELSNELLKKSPNDFEFIFSKVYALTMLAKYNEVINLVNTIEEGTLSNENYAQLISFAAWANYKNQSTAIALEKIELAEQVFENNAFVQFFKAKISEKVGNDYQSFLDRAMDIDTTGKITQLNSAI